MRRACAGSTGREEWAIDTCLACPLGDDLLCEFDDQSFDSNVPEAQLLVSPAKDASSVDR